MPEEGKQKDQITVKSDTTVFAEGKTGDARTSFPREKYGVIITIEFYFLLYYNDHVYLYILIRGNPK